MASKLSDRPADLVLFAGTANPELAEAIARSVTSISGIAATRAGRLFCLAAFLASGPITLSYRGAAAPDSLQRSAHRCFS